MDRHLNRSRARGIAAIALLLILTAGAAMLVPRLAATTRSAVRASDDAAVLGAARDALIGYAVAYPERVNAAYGPGYLPCPARDRHGIAGPACARATGTTVGRFPWHTLRVNDLRDRSGAGLWYVLAESHRYNPKREPLSTLTVPSLSHAGEAIVAAVIAPGAPLAHQRRRGGDAADWIEMRLAGWDGAILTRSAPSNDRVVTIGRAALRAALEQRVLGTVAAALSDFARRHGGRLPWLVPLDAPPDAAPRVGVRGGWLAVHPALTPAAPAASRYESALALSWHFDEAQVVTHGHTALLAHACLERLPCTAMPGGPLVAGAECVWWAVPGSVRPAADHARCTATTRRWLGGVRIEYRLGLAVVADAQATVVGPSATQLRTRTLRVTRLAAHALASELEITLDLTVQDTAGRTAQAHVTLTPRSRGEFVLAGLCYALDAAAGELPAWLVSNAWLRQVALAHATCDADQPCLALIAADAAGQRYERRDIKALLVATGPPLAASAAAHAGGFEDANRDALRDLRQAFLDAPPGEDFNDRVHVFGVRP